MTDAVLPKPADVRELFRAEGTTMTRWAKARGFSRESVYAVLSGRSKGERGEAHKIAVALGLKEERTVRLTEMPVISAPLIPATDRLSR